MTWTQQDETRLRKLQNEVGELRSKREDAVAMLRDALVGALGRQPTGVEVDRFIAHAVRVRDALAPFDSGVRHELPKTLAPVPPEPAPWMAPVPREPFVPWGSSQ